MPNEIKYNFSGVDNIIGQKNTPEEKEYSVFIGAEDSISARHNNPGNLIYVGQEGATKGEARADGTHWAKFETPKAGYEALKKDLEFEWGAVGQMTETEKTESLNNIVDIAVKLFSMEGVVEIEDIKAFLKLKGSQYGLFIGEGNKE